MSPRIADRFRTGDVCNESGWYFFDGYLAGVSEMIPNLEEMEIWVSNGSQFPAVFSSGQRCYWVQARRPETGKGPDFFG